MKRTSAKVDLALYDALLTDVSQWRPDLHAALRGDLNRLGKYGEGQLKAFVMIDLVDTGKIVDKALSTGRISSKEIPRSLGRVLDAATRRFLSSLFREVFSPVTGDVYDDVDPNAVYFLRQVLYLSKKVKEECSDASTLKEVRDFSVIDRALRRPTLWWDACSELGGRKTSRLSFIDGHQTGSTLFGNEECPKALLRAFDDVCRLLISKMPVFDWRSVHPSHGPGAVADARSGSDKYLFPTWPDKLESVFPHSYFARSREDLDIEEPMSYSNVEPPAKLIAVPKVLKGPRMIASEPTAHQFIQHGLMRWMRDNLPLALRNSVDFLDQNPSRDLCIQASSHGLLATVDLSSASDRLSCWVVERVFQYNWDFLSALWASRTRTCRVAVRNREGKLIGEEDFLLLRKFAPMGSAVTFPVQSIVYAAAAIAATLYSGKGSLKRISMKRILEISRQVRVFGDDIILPSSAIASLALLLQFLELKVNVSKTHWQGYFRESCGMDAYKGVNVTPTYLSAFDPGQLGEDIASWIDVSNNVYSAGLINLAHAMDLKVTPDMRRLIPMSSVREPYSCLTLHTFVPHPPVGKVRWNQKLHLYEVQALCLSDRSSVVERDGYQSLLQFFVDDPSPFNYWKAGVAERPRLRLRKRWVPCYQFL